MSIHQLISCHRTLVTAVATVAAVGSDPGTVGGMHEGRVGWVAGLDVLHEPDPR
jgi:hypothetical protein